VGQIRRKNGRVNRVQENGKGRKWYNRENGRMDKRIVKSQSRWARNKKKEGEGFFFTENKCS